MTAPFDIDVGDNRMDIFLDDTTFPVTWAPTGPFKPRSTDRALVSCSNNICTISASIDTTDFPSGTHNIIINFYSPMTGVTSLFTQTITIFVHPVPCPIVCTPLWELKDNACVFDSCGSGCGADNVNTFDRKEDCESNVVTIITPIEPDPCEGTIFSAYEGMCDGGTIQTITDSRGCVIEDQCLCPKGSTLIDDKCVEKEDNFLLYLGLIVVGAILIIRKGKL